MTIFALESLIKEMKLATLLILILFVLTPQIQTAWGEAHCVTDCQEKPLQNETQHTDDEASHVHSHHCSHTYTLSLAAIFIYRPHLKIQRQSYSFIPYQSEEHPHILIEPPILDILS